ARGQVDRAVAALGPDDAPVTPDDLTAVRVQAEDPSLADDVLDQYIGLDTKLSDAIALRLVSIRYEADDLAGSSLVNASLDGLIAATTALDAVDKQIGALSELFRDTTPGDGVDITLVD